MRPQENLNLKNIRDFVPGDTIYLTTSKYSGKMIHETLFCEFIKFEKNKVTGKVLSVEPNPTLHEQKVAAGWEETVPLYAAALYGQATGEDHARFHKFDPLGYAAYTSPEEKFLRSPKEHPSYGMLTLSKTQSSNAHPFFGSSILQNTAMSFTISRATLHRSLYEDRYHAGEELIRLEMTPQQFTDMLTSPNTCGVPVTILHFNRENCGDTPFVSKLEQFHSEFQQKIEEINAMTKQMALSIQAILDNPKALSKKDKEHISGLLKKLVQEVESNIPFMGEQFSEQMEKTVGEAKSVLQQFVRETATQLGVPVPKAMPLLLGGASEA